MTRFVDPSVWASSEQKARNLNVEVTTLKDSYKKQQDANLNEDLRARRLVRNLQTREMWAEVYKAINECLPRDIGDQQDQKEIAFQNRMVMKSITTELQPDLTNWYKTAPTRLTEFTDPQDDASPPTGAGYVFTLVGYHYHDDPLKPESGVGEFYVADTLLKNLRKWTVEHKGNPPVGVGQIGISHPVFLTFSEEEEAFNPKAPPPNQDNAGDPVQFGGNAGPQVDGGLNRRGDEDDDKDKRGRRQMRNQNQQLAGDKDTKHLKKTWFIVQFAWKPTPTDSRPAADPRAATANAAQDPTTTAAPAAAK